MFQKVTKELKKNKVLKAGIGYTIRQLFPEGPRIYYRSHFFQTDGGV